MGAKGKKKIAIAPMAMDLGGADLADPDYLVLARSQFPWELRDFSLSLPHTLSAIVG